MTTKLKSRPIKVTMPESASLANRAILVAVKVSQWDARKIDKAETAAVISKHNTAKKAARVHKSLLPGAKELEAIHKYVGEMRTFVYKQTLPWSEGLQILRTTGFVEFGQEISRMRTHFDNLVDDFIYAYPSLVWDAQQNLGSMFDAGDYPAQDQLREKFNVRVDYLPVPEASDWRVDVGNDALDQLRESVETQLRESQHAAMQEAWRRVVTVVQHAHERLSQPTAIFRNSLIENAVELCELLPSLNIANDPNLEKIRRELQQSLCAHDPRTLRASAAARSDAATKLAATMSKMKAFYAS